MHMIMRLWGRAGRGPILYTFRMFSPCTTDVQGADLITRRRTGIGSGIMLRGHHNTGRVD